ncbi:MAG: hypothetical protein WKF79_12450, partial [Nocardioides sp.]
PVKDAGFLSCSEYDRADPLLRHPPACEWFDSPTRPSARTSVKPMASVDGQDRDNRADLVLLALGGLVLLTGLDRRRWRRRAA